MSASDFDAAIAAHRAEVDALKRQMQPHYDAFLEATAQFLTAKYREALDTIAKGDPARLLELGPDGIRELKVRAIGFIARAPQFVSETLTRANLWSHKQDQDGVYISDYYKGLYRADDNPPQRLTELLNRIQALFEKIAFFMVNHGFVIHDPSWTDATNPRFLGQLELSQPMLNALRSYSDLHDRLVDAYIALGTMELARIKAGIDQLWDQA